VSSRASVTVPPVSSRASVTVPPVSSRASVTVPPVSSRASVTVHPVSSRASVTVHPVSSRASVCHLAEGSRASIHVGCSIIGWVVRPRQSFRVPLPSTLTGMKKRLSVQTDQPSRGAASGHDARGNLTVRSPRPHLLIRTIAPMSSRATPTPMAP